MATLTLRSRSSAIRISPNFSVPNIGMSNPQEIKRIDRRVALRKNLDNLQRAFDVHGELDALDQFEAQALTLLTNPQTKEAFDLSTGG